MRRFDSELEIESDRPPPRAARRRREPAPDPERKQLTDLAFPDWARVVATSGALFSAGAGLALLDDVLRAEPAFVGALRRRLALRAGAAAASIAGLREEETALRDAYCLAPPGGGAISPGGRLHALWREHARRPTLDAATLAAAAALLDLPAGDWAALAEQLSDMAQRAAHPLAAAAHSAEYLVSQTRAGRASGEILALWAADIVLADRLKWATPLPLAIIGIGDPTLRRGPNNRRPRPGDNDWADTLAGAVACAAPKALALVGELARRSETLRQIAPRLRARGAARVVALILEDDAVSAAHAARESGLSDRATRRLFDRLTAASAVRELTGRTSFRLYGL